MANRYWVGGTNTWNGTAGSKWAATSGGAGGQSLPTSSDDVFFDAASGSVIVDIESGNTGAKSINFTGFTGEITGTDAISVVDNITLGTGMTISYTGIITITGACVFTSNGKVLGSNVTLNGTSLTFADAFESAVLTLTAGSLDLNEQVVKVGQFSSSGSTTRSIDFTNATLDLTGTGSIVYNTGNATNLSISGQSTGLILLSAATSSSRTVTMDFSPLVLAPSIEVAAGSNTVSFSSANCYNFVAGSGFTAILNGGLSVYNDFTMHSNNANSSLSLTMSATSGTHTINSAGKSMSSLAINGAGGTFEIPSALVLSSSFTVTAGTFNSNNYDITASAVTGTGASVAAMNLGTSHVVITGASTAWQVTNANLALSAASATLEFTVNSASVTNVYLGGKTVGTIHVNTLGVGAFAIRDSLGVINNFKINAGRLVEFTNSSVTTVNGFEAVGSSGSPITLRTLSNAAVNWSIVYGGDGVVSCDWLDVKRSQASPSNTWYAGANSVDSGNNTGWLFQNAPGEGGASHQNVLLLGVG